MKKFAKLFAVAFAALTVLTAASGCSARTPSTTDSFQKLAKDQGFSQIEDATASYSPASKAISAAKSESDTQLVFLQYSDDSDAQDEYQALKKQAAPNGGGNSVDSATYNRYIVTNGELYYNIIRMDSTLLFCQATDTNKDEVDSFVKAIKY